MIIFARKKGMTRLFDDRVLSYPVTILDYSGCRLINGLGNSGYFIGIGVRKHSNKPLEGIFGKNNVPVLFEKIDNDQISDHDNLDTYFDNLKNLNFGYLLKVTGYSKGKGFAGVVKRWGFAGGPKTRGQSDRHRHPGSIGSGTTVGRVLKGLKMGGRMGNEKITIRNIKLFSVDHEKRLIMVVGSVPGTYDSIVKLNI